VTGIIGIHHQAQTYLYYFCYSLYPCTWSIRPEVVSLPHLHKHPQSELSECHGELHNKEENRCSHGETRLEPWAEQFSGCFENHSVRTPLYGISTWTERGEVAQWVQGALKPSPMLHLALTSQGQLSSLQNGLIELKCFLVCDSYPSNWRPQAPSCPIWAVSYVSLWGSGKRIPISLPSKLTKSWGTKLLVAVETKTRWNSEFFHFPPLGDNA
jgi:hypothetical protein